MENKKTEVVIQSQRLETLSVSKEYKNLTIAEKEIVSACLEPNIRNFTDAEFRKNMLVLIGKTHLNCGFKLDEMQVGLTVDELCADLKKYNGTLSFQEIQIAFTNGYKKQYGDFYGLSNATYFGWVNAYTYGINRTNAKKAIENANKPKAEPEPSEQEKYEQVLKGALRTFEDYKNGVVLFDPGNYAYNFLDKLGLIKFTTEEKKRIYNETHSKIRVNTLNNKHRTETVQQALDKALNPDLVKAEAKREALRQYFKGLVEMEIELSDELETLRTT